MSKRTPAVKDWIFSEHVGTEDFDFSEGWREPKNTSAMKEGLYPKAKDGGIIRRRKLIIQTDSNESAGI